MDKRLFTLIGGCLLTGVVEAEHTKPNVIIIYTDDQGTLDANFLGANDLYTPNLDALAAQGTQFSQFYHDVLHFDFDKQWCVRHGDWKLINNAIDVLPNDKTKVIEGLFLGNLNEDPTESVNLKDKYPEKVEELLKLREKYVISLHEE